MIQIGGLFGFDQLPDQENHYFEGLVPPDGDLRFLMSGRCANYYALEDILLTDTKKTAYVPLYTCETVIAPFVKAGYRLLFYDFRRDMTPVFDPGLLDKISVISICGYYGFCAYDREFVKACHERGIIVLEDATHSIFSADGIDPCCDYVVGSLRKWMGVPSGGFAIKMHGRFTLPMKEPDETHLALRIRAIEEKEKARASDLFWRAEFMLRQIFDDFRGDRQSERIMRRYDFKRLMEKRRENYGYLAEHVASRPGLTVVFPHLTEGTVPSHFTVYAGDRPAFQSYMEQRRIHTTSYWPKGPLVDLNGHEDAAYIYDHVVSIPCDQRYGLEEMEYICRQISQC